MRGLSFVVSLVCMAGLGQTAPSNGKVKARYWRPEGADLIDNEYLVELKPHHTVEDHFKAIGQNLEEDAPAFEALDILPGYYAKLDDEMLEKVRDDPGVVVVQHNTRLPPNDDVPEPSSKFDMPDVSSHLEGRAFKVSRQRQAPFNLVQTSIDYKRSSKANGDYQYPRDPGYGVLMFIVDGGINSNHRELQGRVRKVVERTENPYCPSGSWSDFRKHGTQVASIAAGTTYGIAKGAIIVNVPAICTSSEVSLANIARALNHVLQYHKAHAGRDGPEWFRGSVVNMSFGYPHTSDHGGRLRSAFKQLFDAGIVSAAAAGNGDADARSAIPCSFSESVICVGSVDSSYKKSDFSNYGPAVDILAPGNDIIGAHSDDANAVVIRSGTSMATPHISGILGIFTSIEKLDDPQRAYRRLMANRLTGMTSGFPKKPPTLDGFATNGIALGAKLGKPYLTRGEGVSVNARVAIADGPNVKAAEAPSMTTKVIYSTVHSNYTYVTDTAVPKFEGSNILRIKPSGSS